MIRQWVNWRVHMFFFFQAEDGIRDAQESRGLGDVYKRQELESSLDQHLRTINATLDPHEQLACIVVASTTWSLSLIHI